METKELKVQIPEGYEIDKENSTFEKIIFKKKDTKPRSWEEYLFKHNYRTTQSPFLALPNENMAKAHLAMMKLTSLRQDWVGDWEPDWSDYTYKYCISWDNNTFAVYSFKTFRRSLSFQTKETAEDFMNCFKDLLEIAKPII